MITSCMQTPCWHPTQYQNVARAWPQSRGEFFSSYAKRCGEFCSRYTNRSGDFCCRVGPKWAANALCHAMFPPHSEDQAAIVGLMKLLKQPASQSVRSESMTWLVPGNSLPIWSRRLRHNLEGRQRHQSGTRWRDYDVEIEDRLWSIWGGLHPRAPWFDSKVRGRQSLGCYVVACCAASIFRRLGDWTSKLLDAIVVNGDKYYRASVESSQRWDQDLSLDDMCVQCDFQDIRFLVQMELVAFGHVYSAPASASMSLLEALSFFFTRFQWGILECQERRFAFGFSSSHDGGYFLYDCSEWDKPIFPDDMGASYVLRARQLLVLLYCMVVTLNVRCKKVGFRLYNVDMVRVPNRKDNEEQVEAESAVAVAEPTT